MQRGQRPVDHYEWFSGFLQARGVTLRVRLLIAGVALSMAASVLVLLFAEGGPDGRLPVTLMWCAMVGGVAGAALWLCTWPSRVQSIGFAAVTSLSIAIACLAYPDPLAALLGCIAFTTIGAYLAFFHETRLVLCNFAVAACVAVVAAVMLAVDGRAALAAVDLWLVLQANIALPLAIHILLQALQGDLRHADLDPLTGLLNRRAFHRQTLSLLARRYEEDRYLIVALVDLDDFKSLNDTLGHSAGDQALVEVAGALRATATPTAVIARSGGEEFLIADVAPSYRAVAVKSQDVCDAIAALTAPVTASIGTAFAALDSSPERDHDGAVDHLIAAADSAMYRAKRSGGNRCHHHGVWPAAGSTS